jgi:hypothetical protein
MALDVFYGLGAWPALRFNPMKSRRHGRNPYIIYNLRDLWRHYGPGLTVFLGLQAGAAFLVGQTVLERGAIHPEVIGGIYGLVCLVLDGSVFMRLRGRLRDEFLRPALAWGILTVVPGLVFWLIPQAKEVLQPWLG